MKAAINRNPWRANPIELYLLEDDGTKVARLTFEPLEQGMFCEPTAHLSGDTAQQLMDELWRAGIRPTEGAGSAGSLAATKAHLEDMRTLVFHSMNTTKA